MTDEQLVLDEHRQAYEWNGNGGYPFVKATQILPSSVHPLAGWVAHPTTTLARLGTERAQWGAQVVVALHAARPGDLQVGLVTIDYTYAGVHYRDTTGIRFGLCVPLHGSCPEPTPPDVDPPPVVIGPA